ncbi:hypothetical protein QYM36_018507 [Artemia franciscana]|uniref:Fibronectin type-III domain-containing protein n=1 Tax=Artemia franciscana TaxID=6661 RepID=A0AA88KTW8_ARTSF|nr:hypothetical protein QYM36_018507 [Artemia franciscana]
MFTYRLDNFRDESNRRNGKKSSQDHVVDVEREAKQKKVLTPSTSSSNLKIQPKKDLVKNKNRRKVKLGDSIGSHKLTEYYPIRRSERKPKNIITEIEKYNLEQAVLSGKEDGVKVGYVVYSVYLDLKEEKWLTVVKLENGPQSDFFLSYQNLLPSTTYLFRVISYNRFGISLPVYSLEEVVTPSKIYLEYGYLQQRPFYHQTWFLVTLAAACVVIVTMLVAILCVKSKAINISANVVNETTWTLEESINTEDLGFAIELRLSARVKTGTLGRRSLASSSGALVKPPPRPASASIAYSDDENAKAYDDNDDGSSVTEKPSLSSSESQSSESEEESVRSNPHSFVNHYANVNDTLRQSWKRQRPVRNYSSYTDSEQERSAVMSLNGGQIVMNNMARSRAPVSGFSSFV